MDMYQSTLRPILRQLFSRSWPGPIRAQRHIAVSGLPRSGRPGLPKQFPLLMVFLITSNLIKALVKHTGTDIYLWESRTNYCILISKWRFVGVLLMNTQLRNRDLEKCCVTHARILCCSSGYFFLCVLNGYQNVFRK